MVYHGFTRELVFVVNDSNYKWKNKKSGSFLMVVVDSELHMMVTDSYKT